MSDETTEQREAEQQEKPDPAVTDGGGQQQQQADKSAATNADTKELDDLRAALKQANDEAAQRRHKIKEMEDQIKKSERAGMDETERLKAELADLQGANTERDQLKAKAEALETAVNGQVEALLKELDVPGHIRELIEPMDAAGKLAYLTKNRAAFVKAEKQKPDIDAGNKGGSGKKPAEIDDKRRKEIRQRYRLRK